MNTLLATGIMGVVMMFSGILLKNNKTIRAIAIVGFIVALVINILGTYGVQLVEINTSGFMRFDRFASFFISAALFCTIIYLLLSSRDMEKVGRSYADYFALLFFISSGIILTSSFTSLLILFLGIEIISIPLYILTGLEKKNLKGNEASLKYFLMGAFSTGLMLMGIALLYGDTGTFASELIFSGETQPSALAIAGILLLLFSMSFKVSAAPFHFWTPDVYDGASAPVTSYMATIVKAAALIAFIRLFNYAFGNIHDTWKLLVAMITALTLFIGNITAVFQQSVKRMLAYSSIAQAGFMMLALLAFNDEATEGILLYVVAYSLATIGLFALLIKMKDYTLDGFNGLAKHEPLLAGTALVFLLSLAGIPLTAGFLSKFYMLKAVIRADGFLWLVIFAVVMAAVSVYYYFRVIQAMYFKSGESQDIQTTRPFKWILVLLAAIIIVLGVYPQLLFQGYYF